MSRLPRYFEYLRVRGEPGEFAFSFLYKAETETFIIADQKVRLETFDPYMFVGCNIDLSGKSVKMIDTPKHPALIPTLGGIILGPMLHEFVAKEPHTLHESTQVMRSAFTALEPAFSQDLDNTEYPGGYTGFATSLRHDGGICFQVPGNCACLDVDMVSSGVFDEGFDAGFAQYALHNADTQSQRASLYAGMGHLARLASEQQ